MKLEIINLAGRAGLYLMLCCLALSASTVALSFMGSEHSQLLAKVAVLPALMLGCVVAAVALSQAAVALGARQNVAAGETADSISVLDAWEALGNDIGLGPSKDELLDSLRFTAALADINEGGNPAWNAVVRERVRQVQGEGYCVEHDDEHARGELGAAALCYVEEAYAQVVDRERQAMERTFVTYGIVPDLWPWSPESWKPAGNPRRNLEKGLALGLAELERLIRADAQEVRL